MRLRSPLAALLYLLGRSSASPLRVCVGAHEVALKRSHPMQDFPRAAADDQVTVDPWVEEADGSRAVLALWAYTLELDAALAVLPEPLRPQMIVRTPPRATLLWIPATPYPEQGRESLPPVAIFLSELARALGTPAPDSSDHLAVPAWDADLVIHSGGTPADLGSLWSWAHETAERRQEKRASQEAESLEPRQVQVEGATGEDDPSPPALPGASDATLPAASGRPQNGEASAASGGTGESQNPDGPSAPPDARSGGATEAISLGIVQRYGLKQQLRKRLVEQAVRRDLMVPKSLVALVQATGRARGLPRDEIVWQALIREALHTLGTDEVLRALGVARTVLRDDGMYGLTDGGWRRLRNLP